MTTATINDINDPRLILVAEDNVLEALLLKKAFAAAQIKHPVQMVSDGQEALDYPRGTGPYTNRVKYPFPNFLVLDLKMPRMDGFDVLRWLRTHPECSVVPTVVLTNSALPDDVQRAYELGANSYIVKPQQLNDLVRMIRCAFEYWDWCEKPVTAKTC